MTLKLFFKKIPDNYLTFAYFKFPWQLSKIPWQLSDREKFQILPDFTLNHVNPACSDLSSENEV